MIVLRFFKQLGNVMLNVDCSTSAKRVAILGASGAGKSMLLKCIAGVEQPDTGFLQINDQILYDTAKKINIKPQQRKIGYLFPNYALFPTMTVKENICVAINVTKRTNTCPQKVLKLLEHFQLNEYMDCYPDMLSSGQKQRVALARILAQEPDVILLDEPFSALDSPLKAKMMQEMQLFLEEYHGIVFLVTHEKEEAYAFSQELFIMDKGSIVEHRTTKELFDSPRTLIGAQNVGFENILSNKAFKANAFHLNPQGEQDIELLISSYSILEKPDSVSVIFEPCNLDWKVPLSMTLTKDEFQQWQQTIEKKIYLSPKDILHFSNDDSRNNL